MDTPIHETGWIEAICGPMFSGKTEELIRRLRRATSARKPVQAFKPAGDTRYSETHIVTHGDVRFRSESVATAAEIWKRIESKTRVVGIDETHFFGASLVAVANQLAASGRQVIVAGLDTDYLGRPFAPMPELVAVSQSITKLLAICARCGNPAQHSQRLAGPEDLIVVGTSGAYEARCRHCFEPGIPKQEVLGFLTPAFYRPRTGG